MHNNRAKPEAYKTGSAQIYGTAESIPDRSIVGTLAKGFMDALYKV